MKQVKITQHRLFGKGLSNTSTLNRVDTRYDYQRKDVKIRQQTLLFPEGEGISKIATLSALFKDNNWRERVGVITNYFESEKIMSSIFVTKRKTNLIPIMLYLCLDTRTVRGRMFEILRNTKKCNNKDKSNTEIIQNLFNKMNKKSQEKVLVEMIKRIHDWTKSEDYEEREAVPSIIKNLLKPRIWDVNRFGPLNPVLSLLAIDKMYMVRSETRYTIEKLWKLDIKTYFKREKEKHRVEVVFRVLSQWARSRNWQDRWHAVKMIKMTGVGEDLLDILKEDPEIMVRKEAMGCTSCFDPLY